MGQRTPQFWFHLALVPALLHALSSFYWATGGDALLWTVGDWAVDMRRDNPSQTALLLAVIGAIKLCGGLVPLANAYGLLPFSRLWSYLSAVAAVVLVVYGGANILLGGASALGAFGSTSDSDRNALLGHVLLWDPLFLLWGLALSAGLITARHSRQRPESAHV